MIKKVLLAVAIATVAGILVYIYFGIIPLFNILQPLFTQAQTMWLSIPETIRGIILLGIPTLFATFFAWTKTRAMQKLEETKVQASQQINQLEGEKGMLAQQLTQSTAKGIEELVTARDVALQSRDEAQTLVTQYKQQIRDIQIRHSGEISSLQARLDKYEPKTVTVVK